MLILRLAYVTEFLIAIVAVFTLWGQTAGQEHLAMTPWYLKLGLGAGAAFACVKATAAAVAAREAWNARTARWVTVLALLAAGCGAATWYVHTHYETGEEEEFEEQPVGARIAAHTPPPPAGRPFRA